MASLSQYTADLQATLNDPLAQFYTSVNLTTWINRARNDTAKATGCIRRLTPSSVPIQSISVTAGGTGYTTATVTISGPDAVGVGFTPATATATVSGGQITAVNLGNPGTGYVAQPTITITGDGTGAAAQAVLGTHMTTVLNQERYTFATLTAAIQTYSDGAGIASVIGVIDVAVSQGALKPVLDWVPWATMQAFMRSINQGSSYPYIWAQYGRDENSTLYLFPVPVGVYEMQCDCYCTAAALSASQTVDLIPDNLYWACVYRAAYYAYISAQRKDDANSMKEAWRTEMGDAAGAAFPGRTPSFYDETY